MKEDAITTRMLKRVSGFIRQVEYEKGQTEGEVSVACMFYFLTHSGYYLPSAFDHTETVGDIEDLYKEGYGALVNDGKLIGFQKENVL